MRPINHSLKYQMNHAPLPGPLYEEEKGSQSGSIYTGSILDIYNDSSPTTAARKASATVGRPICSDAPEVVVYTKLKPMSEELVQSPSGIGSASFGSTKVISAQLYKLAPCNAT